MGAVVSCIGDCFRAVGACLKGLVNAIGSICMAIVNGVVTVLDVIITFFTCGYCGRRRRATHSHHRTSMRRSRI